MFASARLNGALPHGNLDGAARTPPKFNDPRERGGLNRSKPLINDLRAHLFDKLEALNDKEKPLDIERVKVVAEVGQVIINSAKVEVDFMRFPSAWTNGIRSITRHVLKD